MNLQDEFESIDTSRIREFIVNHQEENLHLEFKRISDPADLGPDDRKNLAKALSGFANADGGIIIWGVEAKRNEEGIDCANGTQEIAPLSRLVSRLQELTGHVVKPNCRWRNP